MDQTVERRLIAVLQRLVPLSAYVRLASNCERTVRGSSPLPCKMTGVFDAGVECGIMCRIEILNKNGGVSIIVCSITQVSIDRRFPVAREMTAYRKRWSGDHRRVTYDRRKTGDFGHAASFSRSTELAPHSSDDNIRIP